MDDSTSFDQSRSFICSICDHFLGDINSYYYVLVKNSE